MPRQVNFSFKAATLPSPAAPATSAAVEGRSTAGLFGPWEVWYSASSSEPGGRLVTMVDWHASFTLIEAASVPFSFVATVTGFESGRRVGSWSFEVRGVAQADRAPHGWDLVMTQELQGGGARAERYRLTEHAQPVTSAELRQIMPLHSPERAAEIAAALEAPMVHAELTTSVRQAAFLSQVAVESHELEWLTELSSGEQYENRADLGNTQAGDGPRFKGRGALQITGRANYRAAGQALDIDLENNPELAARLDVACMTAGWYWTNRRLNRFADEGNLAEITRRIRGALGPDSHQAEREAYFAKALQVLDP